jgi:hypothetical protein
MSEENKKLLIRGIAILAVIVAIVFGVRWLQGDTGAFTAMLLNLLVAAILYYRSLYPTPNRKNNNSKRRR